MITSGALEAVCEQRGWQTVAVYDDPGVSDGKGRDEQPGLDDALQDASRGRYDVLCAWSVDRLGRSLADLLNGAAGPSRGQG
jgi:DNA invertase Pin-like site-specific DNA recombinase